MATRGENNHNLCNIRWNAKSEWEGLVPKDQRTDKAFCQFKENKFGYRAVFKQLSTYQKRGLNTIRKMICTWAPPCDSNDTKHYIEAVSAYVNVGPDDVLPITDKEKMAKMVQAMTKEECSVYGNITEIRDGYDMAFK